MFGSLCCSKETGEKGISIDHNIKKGDHLIYWTHVALWPVQVHAICIASRKESISIIDFGLTSSLEEKENKKLSDEHLKDLQGRSRIQIRVITSDKELQKWHKVDYGKKAGSHFWKFWKSKKDNEGKKKHNDDDDTEDENDDKTVSSINSSSSNKEEKNGNNADNEKMELEDDNKTVVIPPSDPTKLVLARVRYILSHPKVLPPHNVFSSNSECIAVWCMTGRWSTLQAAVFLHSTAASSLKSTIMLGMTAATATATITTTQPAWGPLGWVGFTTTKTTTTGYLSVHPWVVPSLVAYGVFAIGAPFLILRNTKKRWETTTQQLTDGFWNWAEPDIYAEAIQRWSNVRCC